MWSGRCASIRSDSRGRAGPHGRLPDDLEVGDPPVVWRRAPPCNSDDPPAIIEQLFGKENLSGIPVTSAVPCNGYSTSNTTESKAMSSPSRTTRPAAACAGVFKRDRRRKAEGVFRGPSNHASDTAMIPSSDETLHPVRSSQTPLSHTRRAFRAVLKRWRSGRIHRPGSLPRKSRIPGLQGEEQGQDMGIGPPVSGRRTRLQRADEVPHIPPAVPDIIGRASPASTTTTSSTPSMTTFPGAWTTQFEASCATTWRASARPPGD